jgi:hypothetical protein
VGLGREVRTEQLDLRDVDRTVLEHVQQDREPPGEAARFDPVPGLPVGQVKHGAAVVVKAGVAVAQVDVASVHLGQVRDDLRRGFTLPGGEGLHARGELVVGEAGKRGEDVVLHARL